MFAGYVPLASQSPYPIIVYFLVSYRPHPSHFLENVIFAITFYLCMYLTYQLSDFLTKNLPILNPYLPQKSENLRPHSSKLIEMQPHYSQSSREDVAPSSSTSPLASCKGVPPPPGILVQFVLDLNFIFLCFKLSIIHLNNLSR